MTIHCGEVKNEQKRKNAGENLQRFNLLCINEKKKPITELRKSTLDTISERKQNYNRSAGLKNSQRSIQLHSENHITSSRENHPQRQRKDHQ